MTSSDLIQAGTFDDVSPTGVVTVYAFYELLPAAATFITTMTVSPGDHITATVSEAVTNNWTIAVTDITTGQTYHTTVSYTSSYSSAEWIEEDPTDSGGQLAPLDNFGTVTFSDGSTIMNGVSSSIATTNPSTTTLVSHGAAVAVPSALSGNGFRVTYQP